MKKKSSSKSFGIFGKVFFYTCLLLVFVVGVFFALFYERIHSTVTITEQQQISSVFQPFLERLEGKTDEETVEIAKTFYGENRSFQFCLENADGSILFQTENFAKPEINLPPGNLLFSGALLEQGMYRFSTVGRRTGQQTAILALSINEKRFYVSGFMLTSSVFDEIVGNAIIAFSLILLTSLVAAAVFAHRIAKPIRTLTSNTRIMAEFGDAPDFPNSNDEIGKLARDVYLMHQNLKDAIAQLEDEIKREREMEENQRNFFSAASHELKTPIAAASAILEGMLEGIIEPEEYHKYFRETLRLMREQSLLVTEILEIVKMNDRMTTPVYQDVELSHFISDTLERFHPLFEIKKQVLRIDVDNDLIIRTDSRLLAKALTNILQNATQNSPQEAEICVSAMRGTNSCVLYVDNSGAYIPDENLLKMFEAFYSDNESRSKEKGLNGLWLIIVKKILDLMEIPFDIKNTKNGVRFSATLPTSEQMHKSLDASKKARLD